VQGLTTELGKHISMVTHHLLHLFS
jgi:hypothetical protein